VEQTLTDSSRQRFPTHGAAKSRRRRRALAGKNGATPGVADASEMEDALQSESCNKAQMPSDAVTSAEFCSGRLPLTKRSAWAKRHLTPRDLRDIAARLKTNLAANRESVSAGAIVRQVLRHVGRRQAW